METETAVVDAGERLEPRGSVGTDGKRWGEGRYASFDKRPGASWCNVRVGRDVTVMQSKVALEGGDEVKG